MVSPVVASEPVIWRVRDRELVLGAVPLLMGIVNVTPDSFSDGGHFLGHDQAIAHGLSLVEAGAALLDIGGESTRPGAQPVPVDEEIARVVPVIRAVAKRVDVPLSIDTTKLEVAQAALEAGASIVNDVSALRFTPAMAGLAADEDAGLVLMHMRGEPRTMQHDPRYTDLFGEISGELETAAALAESVGLDHRAIVLDPGIGFGKALVDNYRILAHLEVLARLGYPLMIGHSRKTFLDPDGRYAPAERLAESVAAGLMAALGGARILRVHDVAAHARALVVYRRWLEAKP
ncbi:MAG: dihydropteroate synthase [Gemmatimonadota bacterium]